ncbi:MAG: PAS domain S-box protein [Actinobacteria bacterium]|nr:PAS domain S-box protein [Actinomycetota bacterium]
MSGLDSGATDASGQRFLLSAFDSIRDGFALLDDEGNLVWVNEWMKTRLASQMPLVGKNCHDVFPGLPNSLLKLLRSHGPDRNAIRTHTLAYPSKGNAGAWLELSLTHIEDDEAESTGALLHVHDITERKLAEQMLTDEIARRRILVEQSRDGIVVLDDAGKVVESNQEFARMLGYSLEEMCSLHVWDWEAGVPRDPLMEMIRTVDAGGDHFETRHRRKDGSLYEVEISTNAATLGERKYIFCVCRDTTDRKRAEKEREDLIVKLQAALEEIKALRGIVPVCSYCHRIRDDKGFWENVDTYIQTHSEAKVSHGICPECMRELFPDLCESEEEGGAAG